MTISFSFRDETRDKQCTSEYQRDRSTVQHLQNMFGVSKCYILTTTTQTSDNKNENDQHTHTLSW
jgi:hypothetical protein